MTTLIYCRFHTQDERIDRVISKRSQKGDCPRCQCPSSGEEREPGYHSIVPDFFIHGIYGFRYWTIDEEKGCAV